MPAIEITLDDTGILYKSFRDYVANRAEHLSMAEKKKLLACFTANFALPLYIEYLNDRKGKKPDYTALSIRHRHGELGVVSVSKAPVFITRKLAVGDATRLFSVGRCIRNYRRPITLYAKLLSHEAMTAYVVARYAGKIARLYDVLANAEKSLRARLYYKLFLRGKTPDPADPLAIALEACLENAARLRGVLYIVNDIYNYLGDDASQAIYADGEKRMSLLLEPTGNCPLRSLTILDLDNDYIAHAADAGY